MIPNSAMKLMMWPAPSFSARVIPNSSAGPRKNVAEKPMIACVTYICGARVRLVA